ncbi:Magnesium-chelatase 60 kDa subunit [Rhodovastum atsumiense]|nr:Magnesium-chelatase 60 kDa subunit [Rhodovastum atsumiense]
MLAAALFALDPAGVGGVSLRSLTGPVRERWIALVREYLPEGAPVRRLPVHVTDGRLLGGLDLAATLRAGRPIAERGLLAEADGGVVMVATAERMPGGIAARLAAVLDAGEVLVERDGIAMRLRTAFGVVALDEGMSPDERPPAALLDRLAFHLDFTGIRVEDAARPPLTAATIAAARARLPGVTAPDKVTEALCSTAMALGIDSIRAPILALRVARAAAALGGRPEVGEEDARVAARLVLGPRATILPADPEQEPPPPEPPPPEQSDEQNEEQEKAEPLQEQELQELVLAAAKAAIPAGLLSQLKMNGSNRARSPSSGKAGQLKLSQQRGRPIGTRAGDPRTGARLNLVETLRVAAPWQSLRRREAAAAAAAAQRPAHGPKRVEVRRDDFRVNRFKQRTETTTIFVVDASGSAALHRLGEAKGAVNLLLADCYVRRDKVALLAFRGTAAELLLPPTNSLVRAKRSLAALPGGGGTPVAAAIDAALTLADAVRRKGQTPVVIFMTDGRANIARDGKPDRPRAEADAMTAARVLRAERITVLLVDTSPRPQPLAAKLAAEMGARYLPLPYANADTLSRAVKSAAQSEQGLARP